MSQFYSGQRASASGEHLISPLQQACNANPLETIEPKEMGVVGDQAAKADS